MEEIPNKYGEVKGGEPEHIRKLRDEMDSPDEVVKDLSYFRDEVAREEGCHSYDTDVYSEPFRVEVDGEEIIVIEQTAVDIQIDALERWYKHQLDEKSAELKRKELLLWDDLQEAKRTIEQQNQKIKDLETELDGVYKYYSDESGD